MDFATMTVEEILEHVDHPGEGWEARATEALEAERAGKERVSLIGKLEDLLEATADEEGPSSGSVWLSTGSQAWHVDVGSPAHERLLKEGAQVVDPPEGAEG